jgi:hypothetical protein
VIEQLSARAAPLLHDPRLSDLRHLLTLVDGTVLETIATVADAFWRDYRDGTPHHAWRLHTHFELQRSIPCDVELTDAVNTGDSDEKLVLRRKLKADRCYVMDRGYAPFTLFNDIHRIGSSYVCRMKENSVYDVIEERVSCPMPRVLLRFNATSSCGWACTPRRTPGRTIRCAWCWSGSPRTSGAAGLAGSSPDPRTTARWCW